MKAKNIENNLALAGALIVLVGVSFAAEDALGFETSDLHCNSRRNRHHQERRSES
jgi:hypothetical protein